jgi:hypothetical protein
MPRNMRGILGAAWQLAQCGGLPYPDLPGRIQVVGAAVCMAARKPSGSDATGPDAARIALLRALHLQKQARRAVVRRFPGRAGIPAV